MKQRSRFRVTPVTLPWIPQGLSIVKGLAEQMGGGVEFTGAPGWGSMFSFCVWVRPVSQDQLPVQAKLNEGMVCQSSTKGQHALLVDDNRINLKVIAAILAKLNWRTTICENGMEAVSLIKQGMKPDLVLMDLQMPVLDGLAATELIRQWEREQNEPHMPIVALTGAAFGEDRERCMQAGMDDYMTKPISLEKLSDVLHRWSNKTT